MNHFVSQGPAKALIFGDQVEISAEICHYLKSFQIDALKFLVPLLWKQESCILNDDDGLGKSVIVAALLSCLGRGRKTLIISENDDDRITNWQFHVSVLAKLTVIIVNDAKSLANPSYDVYVGKWNTLRSLDGFGRFDLVIVDNRGPMLRNIIATTFLIKNFEKKVNLIVSSTDITSNIKLMHNVLRIIGRLEPLYNHFNSFKKKFNLPDAKEVINKKTDLEEYFVRRELLADYCKSFRLKRYKQQYDSELPFVDAERHKSNVKYWLAHRANCDRDDGNEFDIQMKEDLVSLSRHQQTGCQRTPRMAYKTYNRESSDSDERMPPLVIESDSESSHDGDESDGSGADSCWKKIIDLLTPEFENDCAANSRIDSAAECRRADGKTRPEDKQVETALAEEVDREVINGQAGRQTANDDGIATGKSDRATVKGSETATTATTTTKNNLRKRRSSTAAVVRTSPRNAEVKPESKGNTDIDVGSSQCRDDDQHNESIKVKAEKPSPAQKPGRRKQGRTPKKIEATATKDKKQKSLECKVKSVETAVVRRRKPQPKKPEVIVNDHWRSTRSMQRATRSTDNRRNRYMLTELSLDIDSSTSTRKRKSSGKKIMRRPERQVETEAVTACKSMTRTALEKPSNATTGLLSETPEIFPSSGEYEEIQCAQKFFPSESASDISVQPASNADSHFVVPSVRSSVSVLGNSPLFSDVDILFTPATDGPHKDIIEISSSSDANSVTCLGSNVSRRTQALKRKRAQSTTSYPAATTKTTKQREPAVKRSGKSPLVSQVIPLKKFKGSGNGDSFARIRNKSPDLFSHFSGASFNYSQVPVHEQPNTKSTFEGFKIFGSEVRLPPPLATATEMTKSPAKSDASTTPSKASRDRSCLKLLEQMFDHQHQEDIMIVANTPTRLKSQMKRNSPKKTVTPIPTTVIHTLLSHRPQNNGSGGDISKRDARQPNLIDEDIFEITENRTFGSVLRVSGDGSVSPVASQQAPKATPSANGQHNKITNYLIANEGATTGVGDQQQINGGGNNNNKSPSSSGTGAPTKRSPKSKTSHQMTKLTKWFSANEPQIPPPQPIANNNINTSCTPASSKAQLRRQRKSEGLNSVRRLEFQP